MNWLNYHHLLYFWTVAREGTVARAAKKLLLAQSTISGQIRALEKSLKAKLFERVGRNLVLTDAGRKVYRYADEIFSLGRDLQAALEGHSDGRATRLEVGVSDVLPRWIVYLLLQPALELEEQIQLICHDDKTERLLSRLALNELDVVLTDIPAGPLVKIRAYNHLLGDCGVCPSMVIGGCTGAAVGQVFHQWLPQLAPEPGIYAIVGMAGFFAGAAHAPISTIVMVTELTGDYGLLVPALWVSVLCFLLCQRWTLYHKQLPSRLDSPAHRGDFLVDVLEGISVKDVPWKQRTTVFQGMPLKGIVRVVAENRQHYFPVVDKNEGFVGIFSTDDIRGHLYNEELWELANARDVMTSRVVSVTPEHDLNTALKRFTELNLDELPVLDADNPKKLLGMLRRRDVIACYNQKRHDFQKATDDEEADQPIAAQ